MTGVAPRQSTAATWRGADLAARPKGWTWTLDQAQIDLMVSSTERFEGADPQAVGRLDLVEEVAEHHRFGRRHPVDGGL